MDKYILEMEPAEEGMPFLELMRDLGSVGADSSDKRSLLCPMGCEHNSWLHMRDKADTITLRCCECSKLRTVRRCDYFRCTKFNEGKCTEKKCPNLHVTSYRPNPREQRFIAKHTKRTGVRCPPLEKQQTDVEAA